LGNVIWNGAALLQAATKVGHQKRVFGALARKRSATNYFSFQSTNALVRFT